MNDVLKPKEPNIEDVTVLRLEVMAIIILAVLGILIFRLWFLQAVQGETFKKMSEENRIRTLTINSPRGMIYDRNGKIMAINRLSYTMTIDPEKITDKVLIKRVSDLLGLPAKEVTKQIKSEHVEPLKPRVIKRDLTPEIVAFIKEHGEDFKGIDIINDPIREYPNGALGSHILGYLSEISDSEMKETNGQYELGDQIGKSGVEKEYEGVLRGAKGQEFIEVNANNSPIRTLKREEPDPGNNLILTIDADIQAVTEKALANGIAIARKNGFNANAGAAVVMDPKTGEVIAMASLPTYDPRIFSGGISTADWNDLNDQKNLFPLNNRAMMSSYPPGSTFKVVTSVAGLRTGVINEKTRFVCNGSWSGWGKKWIKWCWKKSGHGSRNLIEALTVSCDSFFYDVGFLIHKRGNEELQHWSRVLGLGKKTGIDLPGETTGRIPDKSWKKEFNKSWPENQSWFPGDTVNMSIGQGDTLLSPVQLATIYATVANEGNIPTPHVVKDVLTTDEKAVSRTTNNALKDSGIPKSDFKSIKTGLKQVTKSAEGTAASAFRGLDIEIAGKTGTSEVFGKDDFAFFASFAPADDPQYVIAVVIEQGGHGGSAAAPVARQIYDYLFKK